MRLLPLLLLCLFAACQTAPKGITDAQRLRFYKAETAYKDVLPVVNEYTAAANEIKATCEAAGMIVLRTKDDLSCAEKPKEEKKK